jgi:hypothetical protein
MRNRNIVRLRHMATGLFFLILTSCSCAQSKGDIVGVWGAFQPEVRRPVEEYICINRLDSGRFFFLWANTSAEHPSNTVAIATKLPDGRLELSLDGMLMTAVIRIDKRGESINLFPSSTKLRDGPGLVEFFRVSAIPEKLLARPLQ